MSFSDDFRELTGDPPFPWQEALYQRFISDRPDNIPSSCDLPTGLGKTSVMPIWLLGRAVCAALPRRLVYVVDRRAVVDQATDVAMRIRGFVDSNERLKRALGLESRSLPISTLRGQHIDNKEWLEDPASPAIIVGTIDMIGSRLLFEGYGTSRKMRPYHAGLLGADTLVVLDEAHLVPPFEKLLATIAGGRDVYGSRDPELARIVPPFKLLSLSATGRSSIVKPFGLTTADFNHPVVSRRLIAPKRLTMLPIEDEDLTLADALAKEAWTLASDGTAAVRIIIFCNQRKDAEAAKKAVEKIACGDKKQGIPRIDVDTELFVGGRRVLERERAASWLRERGFLAGSKATPKCPTFVFATSAGEVGVDLDADHMACDLVAWERMVQRLGRVNRRGDGDAKVIVIVKKEPKPEAALKKAPEKRSKAEAKTIEDYENFVAWSRAVRLLPSDRTTFDASPGAIRRLKSRAEEEAVLRDRPEELFGETPWLQIIRIAVGYFPDLPDLQNILNVATTPVPLRPALSRALVDAWSMTSLKEHTGRPNVEPWIRGWIDEQPQTSVVWRVHLPSRPASIVTPKEFGEFFEAAPPHVSEVLETETYRIIEWLEHRANALLASESSAQETPSNARLRGRDIAAVVLSPSGDVREVFKLEQLVFDRDDKKAKNKKDELRYCLSGATLIVDARIAGLGGDGLLDSKIATPAHTADDSMPWLTTPENEPVVRFRVRVADVDAKPNAAEKRRWRQRFRFAIAQSEDGEPSRWLIVEKWLHDSATEDDRSAGHPQLLDTHQQWAEREARQLAERLGLPPDYADMLAIAARLHDEGKRAPLWQKAFKAPKDGDYAKTRGPADVKALIGYRHEFGSLPVAAKDSEFAELPADLQELALHLIAAHHGFARPVISITGCPDAPPSALESRAREVALRFARLQKRWGPWGLAWWEALLRAVDQQASRDNDAEDSTSTEEGE